MDKSVYKTRPDSLTNQRLPGINTTKIALFSCYNQVNGLNIMEYLEFERILSAKRMQRYKDAANGDTRKAMALFSAEKKKE